MGKLSPLSNSECKGCWAYRHLHGIYWWVTFEWAFFLKFIVAWKSKYRRDIHGNITILHPFTYIFITILFLFIKFTAVQCGNLYNHDFVCKLISQDYSSMHGSISDSVGGRPDSGRQPFQKSPFSIRKAKEEASRRGPQGLKQATGRVMLSNRYEVKQRKIAPRD